MHHAAVPEAGEAAANPAVHVAPSAIAEMSPAGAERFADIGVGAKCPDDAARAREGLKQK